MTLTAEQLELRRQGVGASEVGAIVGVNPYATAWDVYNRKTGVVSDEIDNIHTRLGHALEPLLVNEYRERTGNEVEYPCGTVAHPDCSWALATPDGLYVAPDDSEGIVECKVAGWRMRHKWGPEGTDEVPDEYLVQCAWQMFVCNKPRAHLIVLLDREVRIYRIERNVALEKRLVEKVDRFWHHHVLQRIPPDIDGSDGAREFFERSHNDPSEEVAIGDDAAEELAEQLLAAQTAQKAAKAECDCLKALFMARIADRRGIQTSLGKVLWYPTKARAQTNWPAVANAAGATDALIAKHTKFTEPKRTFRATLKRPEGEE